MPSSYQFKVICHQVRSDEYVVLTGSSDLLGNWDHQKALRLETADQAIWKLTLDASKLEHTQEYKFAIFSKTQNCIVNYEPGQNRHLHPIGANDANNTRSETVNYIRDNYKAAGLAIPIFSLRSEESSGIGEFTDIKKMVDWAELTNQSVIQVLPINDTTITYTWTDSYPYNAITTYALHPIYLGLQDYPLKNEASRKKYKEDAAKLNKLPQIDYDAVIKLKTSYIKELFAEIGQETLKDKEFKAFYDKNQEWLFPYACFCYFRDQYHTANPLNWKEHSTYDKKKLEGLIASNKDMKGAVEIVEFTQYLLDKQLIAARRYAHSKGVILKGDIPIGVSRNSVEAWTEPHLFNLDTQTGAPPDDFAENGQNWGFPTYKWEEMEKDGYSWWKRRFGKMADYFDAYRIDHILGFFRIWEIPTHSVQGLLGYFVPSLPMHPDEIRSWGLYFDEYRLTKPYIHEHFLWDYFGEHMGEVKEKYLNVTGWERFELKEEFNTQQKIKEHFGPVTDAKSVKIRDGLYDLCNEVLFIRDKRQPDRFHPRITGYKTNSYKHLSHFDKQHFDRIYHDYFMLRHSQFWRDQAMKKLPALVSSTSMLCCGEDLGMIPNSVPAVMRELKILSLEVERMPKTPKVLFEYLGGIPYESVCTTSSHDMNPIRAWWLEDRETTQKYYNEVLQRWGEAPHDCNTEISEHILRNHLFSPAMLAIIPLQDLLSIDDKLRASDPNSERINVPANPEHYWRYRMHLSLEELMKATDFNNRIKNVLKEAGRTEKLH